MTVAPAPGPHGGDGARLADALGVPPDHVLDLSASSNPVAPDATALVRAHADAIRRYPDAERATEALASAIGVDVERVVLTNGGAEAIALVAGECPVGRVDPPEFALYARHLARVDDEAPRWRSNPHNPTGLLARPDERAAVWDEAFFPLATGRWTRGDSGSVVVGSLTKLFDCPGLRVGYVLAPDASFAARLRARQPQWAVNGLACAVVPELLASADLDAWWQATARLRDRLGDVLDGAGLTHDHSDAPYVLVRDARGVREHLARRAVLVRDTSSFGIPDGIRVAVPPDAGIGRLADALTGWRR
jgi:histidinol-phosphate/aromatic aminotransferase/cobyric acid decarboxylase-like protein